MGILYNWRRRILRPETRVNIGIRCPLCNSFKIIRTEGLTYENVKQMGKTLSVEEWRLKDGYISHKQHCIKYVCLDCKHTWYVVSNI